MTSEDSSTHLPLIEAADAHPDEVKPTWRGWIHAGTFPVTIVAGIVLLIVADGPAAKWSCFVFVLSSILLIAGSYTPITVLALPTEKATLLLWIVWGGAGLGIAFRVFWIHAPRWLYVPLYLLLSYGALIFIVDFFTANAVMMTLILVGGLCYTVGAVVYGLKRPNPVPGVFGFHEIFHTLTVVAFLCHFTAITMIAVNPLYP